VQLRLDTHLANPGDTPHQGGEPINTPYTTGPYAGKTFPLVEAHCITNKDTVRAVWQVILGAYPEEIVTPHLGPETIWRADYGDVLATSDPLPLTAWGGYYGAGENVTSFVTRILGPAPSIPSHKKDTMTNPEDRDRAVRLGRELAKAQDTIHRLREHNRKLRHTRSDYLKVGSLRVYVDAYEVKDPVLRILIEDLAHKGVRFAKVDVNIPTAVFELATKEEEGS